jgi:hypothetical protein
MQSASKKKVPVKKGAGFVKVFENLVHSAVRPRSNYLRLSCTHLRKASGVLSW